MTARCWRGSNARYDLLLHEGCPTQHSVAGSGSAQGIWLGAWNEGKLLNNVTRKKKKLLNLLINVELILHFTHCCYNSF